MILEIKQLTLLSALIQLDSQDHERQHYHKFTPDRNKSTGSILSLLDLISFLFSITLQ